MKIYFLLAFLFIQGCSSAETKKPLNYLHGENYNTSDVTNVPSPPLILIPQGKERVTKLSGSVVMDQGPTRIPLKMQKVTLKKDDKALAETITDMDGSYRFSGVYVNGDYKLYSDSKNYKGELFLRITDYKQNNLVIVAEAK